MYVRNAGLAQLYVSTNLYIDKMMCRYRALFAATEAELVQVSAATRRPLRARTTSGRVPDR